MPVPIISASGTAYGMVVNPDGSINVNASGVQLSIGSLAVSLESIYVTSGNVVVTAGSIYSFKPLPRNNIDNAVVQLRYIISGTATGVTGSQVGSIIKFIGTGSYVKTLTYSNNVLVTAGSWV